MPAEAAGIHARLEAWRRHGADRADPPRFALMAALAQRATRFDGTVRQQLETRLQQLADAYAGVLAQPAGRKPQPGAGGSPLRELLQQFDSAPRVEARSPAPAMAPVRAAGAAMRAAGIAPLPVLDEFQQLWSRIRIDSLLRQCLDGLPEDAGPLHSSVLTYRAMDLMREVSPGYLQHFVAYTDALSWLEQLGGNADNAAEGASSPRKPARAGSTRRKKQPS